MNNYSELSKLYYQKVNIEEELRKRQNQYIFISVTVESKAKNLLMHLKKSTLLKVLNN